MKLLLDEMYAPAIADQLRARGHDVCSLHDPTYQALEGEPVDKVWTAAIADDRALATENVQDFRRIDDDALARQQPRAPLIFTTDRHLQHHDPLIYASPARRRPARRKKPAAWPRAVSDPSRPGKDWRSRVSRSEQ
jgi:predicted nuclease of predicted toxin-antitoxin system